MPSPAYNTTPIYQPSDKRPFLKGKKRKIITLVGVIVFASVMAYIATKNQVINIPNPFSNEPDAQKDIVDTKNGLLKEDFVKNIENVTIEDIKEASVSTGINPLDSPSLSDEKTSAQIYEEIGNDEPENHFIGYSDYGVSEPYKEIKQGDLVTWVNTSTVDMNVVGDGWDSTIPREPGTEFTYTFIFLGEYKYKINDQFEGTVMVVQ